MELTDDLRNAALEVALEFGGRRGTPREPRVLEQVPGATPEQVAAALAAADAAQDRAYALTAAAWPLEATDHATREQVRGQAEDALAAELPWLRPETLAHLVSQAHYWHFRE